MIQSADKPEVGTLVEEALEVAESLVQQLISDERAPTYCWGPRYVNVVVITPFAIHEKRLGFDEPWNSEWGEEQKDFSVIAGQKAITARRERRPTSELVNQASYAIAPGDYVWPGGVSTTDGKIGVGVSGFKGLADEGIAQAILDIIVMNSRLYTDTLVKAGVEQFR